jgi:hypothetical protein
VGGGQGQDGQHRVDAVVPGLNNIGLSYVVPTVPQASDKRFPLSMSRATLRLPGTADGGGVHGGASVLSESAGLVRWGPSLLCLLPLLLTELRFTQPVAIMTVLHGGSGCPLAASVAALACQL